MAEYIEREAAIEAVSLWYGKALHPENMSSYNEGERDAYRTAASEIANIPAADMRPVVRGKWVDEPIKGVKYHCSVCQGRFNYTWHYCPNCGADMRGES